MKYFDFDSRNYNNNSAQALLDALNCSYAAVQNSNIRRIVIILPTQASIGNIESILLANGYRKTGGAICKIGCSTNVVITSVGSYNHIDTDAVIFYGLNSQKIFEVEELGTNVLEIAVKDYSNYDLWKGTWGAVDPKTRAFTLLEPTDKVKHAFDQLTNAINITHTHAFHPSDEDVVKKFIRTLHALEPDSINPDDVFAYLRREKQWTLGLCKLVCEWLDRLNHGRTFQGGVVNKTEMNSLYANW